MTRDEELLVEQAVSAWRPRAPDGTIRAHPAWHDLGDEGRRAVFEATALSRTLEAASDPEGLSATGRRVLDLIRAAR